MPRLMADVVDTLRTKPCDCHCGALIQERVHKLAAESDDAAISRMDMLFSKGVFPSLGFGVHMKVAGKAANSGKKRRSPRNVNAPSCRL